jgi:hypothetical protein
MILNDVTGYTSAMRMAQHIQSRLYILGHENSIINKNAEQSTVVHESAQLPETAQQCIAMLRCIPFSHQSSQCSIVTSASFAALGTTQLQLAVHTARYGGFDAWRMLNKHLRMHNWTMITRSSPSSALQQRCPAIL